MKSRRLSNGLQHAKAVLERFRLPLLILALGALLLLLPSGGTGKAAQDAQSPLHAADSSCAISSACAWRFFWASPAIESIRRMRFSWLTFVAERS